MSCLVGFSNNFVRGKTGIKQIVWIIIIANELMFAAVGQNRSRSVDQWYSADHSCVNNSEEMPITLKQRQKC